MIDKHYRKPGPDTPACRACSAPITTDYGIERYRKRGYGYCSAACAGIAKTDNATKTALDRFMRRVIKRGDNECWPFDGKEGFGGYRVFHWRAQNDKRVRPHPAHRAMWIFVNGPIPDGLFVCHSCDNPPCCNPKHLWLGTSAENTADMIRKGRDRKNPLRGSRVPNSKLSENDVIVIRADRQSNAEMARKFGVSAALISKIRLGKAWSHVSMVPHDK